MMALQRSFVSGVFAPLDEARRELKRLTTIETEADILAELFPGDEHIFQADFPINSFGGTTYG